MDADRIFPGLYLGGAPRDCGPFDVIVLAARELQHIPLKCLIVRAPLDDAVLSRKELETALQAARLVWTLRRQGKKILVTCAQGRNRSALIVGLVLLKEGFSAKKAVALIREKRRVPGTLSNEFFVQILQRYEVIRAKGNS